MSKPFVVLLMVFCHIINDYYLQGILAELKQKTKWVESYRKMVKDDNAKLPDKYRFDYIAALVMHCMSWSFMIMLPIAYVFGFAPPVSFFLMFAANTIIHAIVDDLKANRMKINLITDQLIHLLQIGLTAYVMLWAVA